MDRLLHVNNASNAVLLIGLIIRCVCEYLRFIDKSDRDEIIVVSRKKKKNV